MREHVLVHKNETNLRREELTLKDLKEGREAFTEEDSFDLVLEPLINEWD